MGFRLGSTGPGGTVSFGPPAAQIDVGDPQVAGTSTDAARSDHQHAYPGPTAAPEDLDATGAEGTSERPARQDHTHAHTGADHLSGGHADLSGDYDAAAAASAVSTHETTYDHTAFATESYADTEAASAVSTHETTYDHTAFATESYADTEAASAVSTHETTYDHDSIVADTDALVFVDSATAVARPTAAVVFWLDDWTNAVAGDWRFTP